MFFFLPGLTTNLERDYILFVRGVLKEFLVWIFVSLLSSNWFDMFLKLLLFLALKFRLVLSLFKCIAYERSAICEVQMMLVMQCLLGGNSFVSSVQFYCTRTVPICFCFTSP